MMHVNFLLERREQGNRNHQDCGTNCPKSTPWLLQTTCVQSNGIFYVHHGVPRIQSKHVDTHTHTHTQSSQHCNENCNMHAMSLRGDTKGTF